MRRKSAGCCHRRITISSSLKSSSASRESHPSQLRVGHPVTFSYQANLHRIRHAVRARRTPRIREWNRGTSARYLIPMRYLPKSESDRQVMLQEIGVKSIDDLFESIPPQYRLKRDLKIPRQMAESEIVDWFRARSAENGTGYSIFLGAGAYNHYRPVVIDSLISRGEFFTAYTPYQPEIAQGTLQSIFEFQTMICELTGMEVANASM